MARPSAPNSRPRRRGKPPAPARVNVAGIRREQIVDAAASIIASQGIQNLSLSAIEAETGMSRGQLTYYFKAKEDILLAVFDRMVRRMRERFEAGDQPCGKFDIESGAWGKVCGLLGVILDGAPPPDFIKQLHQLQYTFLAQTGHREDFRERLALLFGGWRSHMAEELAGLEPKPAADPRLLASLVQALVHGLVMQLLADANAFDRTAMLELCVDLLGHARNRPERSPSIAGRRSNRGEQP